MGFNLVCKKLRPFRHLHSLFLNLDCDNYIIQLVFDARGVKVTIISIIAFLSLMIFLPVEGVQWR